MNKKATFSAAVLLAMGTATGAGAATTYAPSGDSSLNIPLPGTMEYISASRLVDDSFIVSAAKKKPPKPKKK
jgi:hypothetical protein